MKNINFVNKQIKESRFTYLKRKITILLNKSSESKKWKTIIAVLEWDFIQHKYKYNNIQNIQQDC